MFVDRIIDDPALGLVLDEVVQVLEDEAENANRHHLDGKYKALAGILSEETGDELALKIMLRVAAMGGFTG